jgi:NCS1 family nucleobase:cation symporter-1
MSFTIHFVICKYISVPTESIISEAVYPPGPEGYDTPVVEGSVLETEKGAYVNEKEAESPV